MSKQEVINQLLADIDSEVQAAHEAAKAAKSEASSAEDEAGLADSALRNEVTSHILDAQDALKRAVSDLEDAYLASDRAENHAQAATFNAQESKEAVDRVMELIDRLREHITD